LDAILMDEMHNDHGNSSAIVEPVEGQI
jgi:hypothetical protein